MTNQMESYFIRFLAGVIMMAYTLLRLWFPMAKSSEGFLRRPWKLFLSIKSQIAGDTITIIENESVIEDDFSLRTRQAFGDATYQKLKQMKIGIIGCSGTGSPTIEQLVRLGVGTIVIIDPDIVEKKNLNRILNTTIDDAEKLRLKTEVLYDAVNKIGLGTTVIKYSANIYESREALDDLITCDAICGCVDSVDGRHLISQLTNFLSRSLL